MSLLLSCCCPPPGQMQLAAELMQSILVSRSFLSLINLSAGDFWRGIIKIHTLQAIPAMCMCGNLDDAALEIRGLSCHISQLPHLPAGARLAYLKEGRKEGSTLTHSRPRACGPN
ncbi:hypothetical protein GQ55_5G002900 [Panicum hallii var. hallii]|uniref:Uncharacterized protein n=1 Tax=Panicum hallii var. hallii TaxID=1504633 RepID=A0A2T7DB81_9POAL|nr:hypothetical protein GQ55_5G002900 [Panicum hallii var. hallii]